MHEEKRYRGIKNAIAVLGSGDRDVKENRETDVRQKAFVLYNETLKRNAKVPLDI